MAMGKKGFTGNRIIYLKERKTILIFFFSLVIFTSYAQQIIEVGGVLNENTEWNSDFIYVVTDDIIIGPGITLQINPGVTVRFNQGRGLVVEAGKLFISGTTADSVKLVPNHTGNETWNWKGIVINSIIAEQSIRIEYSLITKALIGIKTNAAHYLSIKHNTLSVNRNIGISLFNSSFCEIEKNRITHNFLGLEIFATDEVNQSSFNIVNQNIFLHHTTHIIVHNSNMGVCRENLISRNLIQDGIHGIWLYKTKNNGPGNINITDNFILRNGMDNDGYGIYVSMDSVYMSNNLFWRNHQAMSFRVADHCTLFNCSFFQNQKAIELMPQVSGINMQDNTLTGNSEIVIEFNGYENIIFNHNNLFSNYPDKNIAINKTTEDIDMANCYWGTTDNQIIDSLIYDQLDNPELGSLLYQPLLVAPDTNAPVSAPQEVIAQLINGAVKITWKSNPETDLSGYRVYSGEFAAYSFAESTAIITDTIFIAEGLSLTMPVAVTASDQTVPQGHPQLSGNESPFAFATVLPFAGSDAAVCSNTPSFEITESTLPPIFQSSLWTTSGDGYFNDQTSIQPIYFIGEGDRIAGKVTLSLKGFIDEQFFADSMKLTLRNPPEVFAGNDAIIEAGNTFIPVDAAASHFDKLSWSTTGDGIFDDTDLLNPIYSPGTEDIANEETYLILRVSNVICGEISDTLHLVIRRVFLVEGTVWAGPAFLPGNPVIATRLMEASNIPTSFITFTDEFGEFRFDQLFAGKYIFYAPHEGSAIEGFVPSYYVNRIRWQDGFALDLHAETRDLDIRLAVLQTQLPVGAGEISGHFSLPESDIFPLDIYCQSWFGSTTEEYCINGLANITILLYGQSGQRVYACTLTEAAGDFSFYQLPFGTYRLEAEIAGYESMTSEMIVLSPDNPVVSGIQMAVEPKKKISIYIPENSRAQTGLQIFPNPAHDRITLYSDFIRDEEEYMLSVFHSTGILMLQTSVLSNNSAIILDIGSFRPGIYFCRVSGADRHFSFTFFKR